MSTTQQLVVTEAPRKSAGELALEKAKADKDASLERARAKREESKAKWEKKMSGLKSFGKGVGEAWTKVIYFVKDEAVFEAYVQEAREAHDNNVAEMKAGWKAIKERVSGGIDRAVDGFSSFVDTTGDTIALETRKAGKNLVNAMGTDILAPVLMDVVKPTVKFIDNLETGVIRTSADILSAVSKPLIETSNKLLRNVIDSPLADGIHTLHEAYATKGESGAGWKKALGWVDSKITNASNLFADACILGVDLRNAAGEIRASATGSRHTERVQTMNRLDQDAQKIRTQGIV